MIRRDAWDMDESQEDEGEPILPPRIFIREPAWRVGVKVGSDRVFCHAIAPGEDHYHRLVDGEIFVRNGDEKLCLRCAARKGMLSYAPKRLRERPRREELERVIGTSLEEFDIQSDDSSFN